MNKKPMGFAKWILMLIALYVGAACMTYRLRNPHLTETELMLNIPSALMWRQA